MIRLELTAGDTDRCFHIQSGDLMADPAANAAANGFDARIILPCGLQAFLELYDCAGQLRMQGVRYQSGSSTWTSTAPSSGPPCFGKWSWFLALRNISAIALDHFEPLTAILELNAAVCPIPDEKTDDIGSAEALDVSGTDLPLPSDDPDGFFWLAGDLHQHSTRSDGVLDPDELFRLNRTRGHSFMALTDHQCFHSEQRVRGMVVLSGLEVTTPVGHLNCLGLGEWPGMLRDGAAADDFAGCAWFGRQVPIWRQRGALLVLNHPCFSPWQWRCGGLDPPWFDALEILCDPGHPGSAAASEAALDLWNRLLDRSWRVLGVGGSDFHDRPGDPGWPTTFVGGTERSPSGADLLSAIRTGRMAVGCSFRPELRLVFRKGHRTLSWQPLIHRHPGIGPDGRDSLAPGQNSLAPVHCALVIQGREADCRVIDPAQKSFPWFSLPVFPFLADGSGKPGEEAWVRLDCRDGKGHLIGFTNPVRISTRGT
jgi:hypothetical protein